MRNDADRNRWLRWPPTDLERDEDDRVSNTTTPLTVRASIAFDVVPEPTSAEPIPSTDTVQYFDPNI